MASLLSAVLLFGLVLPCTSSESSLGGETLESNQKRGQLRGSAVVQPSQPLAWCTCGGGFRAMTGAMAFARAFNEEGLFRDPSAVTVAANSGGSWFLGQMAYSDRFRSSVLGTTGSNESLEKVVSDWFQTYHTHLEKQPGLASTKMEDVVDCLDETHPGAARALRLGARHFQPQSAGGPLKSWEDFVGGFLDEYTPGISQTQAAAPANASWGEMLFQIAINPDSLLYDQGKGVLGTLSRRSDGAPVEAPQPLAWMVPAHGSAQEPRFIIPSNLSNFKHSLSRQAFPTGQTESEAEVKFPSFSHERPTVSKIVGASSAAAGLRLGSSWLQMQLKTTVLSDSRGRLQACLASKGGLDAGLQCGSALTKDQCATANALIATGLPEASPCATERAHDGHCAFPNLRLSDGGVIDNLATTMTVARMQARYGSSAPLRLVLTDMPQCGGFLMPKCGERATTSSSLELLFRSGANANVRPGEAYRVAWSLLDLHAKRLSNQVFEMEYSNLEWQELGFLDERQTRSLAMTQVETRTVENAAFGVQAGTPVSALVFLVRSALETDLYEADADKFDLYPQMAQGLYDKLAEWKIVEHWLAYSA